MCGVNDTDLCVAICRFSQVVFVTSNNFTHNLLFYFQYCNRTKFRTRFNFVYFVLLAGSTKFSGIRKPYAYTSVSDTTVAVRKFPAYESWQTLEYEIFTRTKISAITVVFSIIFLSVHVMGHVRIRHTVAHTILPPSAVNL